MENLNHLSIEKQPDLSKMMEFLHNLSHEEQQQWTGKFNEMMGNFQQAAQDSTTNDGLRKRYHELLKNAKQVAHEQLSKKYISLTLPSNSNVKKQSKGRPRSHLTFDFISKNTK